MKGGHWGESLTRQLSIPPPLLMSYHHKPSWTNRSEEQVCAEICGFSLWKLLAEKACSLRDTKIKAKQTQCCNYMQVTNTSTQRCYLIMNNQCTLLHVSTVGWQSVGVTVRLCSLHALSWCVVKTPKLSYSHTHVLTHVPHRSNCSPLSFSCSSLQQGRAFSCHAGWRGLLKAARQASCTMTTLCVCVSVCVYTCMCVRVTQRSMWICDTAGGGKVQVCMCEPFGLTGQL